MEEIQSLPAAHVPVFIVTEPTLATEGDLAFNTAPWNGFVSLGPITLILWLKERSFR